MFPGDPATEAFTRRLAVDECLNDGILKFNSILLRGNLYMALYRRDHGRAPATLAAAPLALAADTAGQASDAAVQYISARVFAECVVRKDPALSRELVLAEIGGKREDAAYAAARRI